MAVIVLMSLLRLTLRQIQYIPLRPTLPPRHRLVPEMNKLVLNIKARTGWYLYKLNIHSIPNHLAPDKQFDLISHVANIQYSIYDTVTRQHLSRLKTKNINFKLHHKPKNQK